MASTTVTTDAPHLRSSSITRGETIALLTLTALALLLRVTSLSRSLFTDEAYSLALAQRSFGHMIALFGYEANGTPYSIVLWPVIRIFGSSAAVLRLPAVLAGTASIPALYWAARGFVREHAVALLAAALLAINPMAVWYSQEARSYAFVVLAACLSFGALVRAVSRGDENGQGHRVWVGYVAAMALLAYSDLLAAPIAIPAQALIVWRAGRKEVRRWLWSLLALSVCCLPLLVAAGISRSRRDPLYWLPKLDRELVELALQEFTGGFSGVSAVRWVTLAAGLVLVVAALSLLRRGSAALERSTFAIAACWGLVPVGLLLVVSAVEPVFWPRYAIVALPGLCLLGALAAGRLWRHRRGVVLAGVCVAILVGVGLFADARQVKALQENWPPIAAWLRAERTPGQPTLIDNALVLPSLGYYDPTFRARNGELIVQEWRELPLPVGFVGFKDRTGYGSVPNGPPSAAVARRMARNGGGAFWMIFAEVDPSLQSAPLQSPAVIWARNNCHVQERESTGIKALHVTDCTGFENAISSVHRG
jgi:4-amino-4-deoxy-L-arabinose transferase-like glycosyltransferase